MRSRRRHLAIAVHVAVALGLAGPILVSAQQSQIQDKAKRYVSGQNVQPVFEGWERNKDGTFSFYFGYLNRNYEELVDVPVGPDNQITPGGDRGQPTHFLPRRQTNVFFVVVPKDFGLTDKVEWTIKAHGVTDKVAGTLMPIYEINATYDTTTGNRPPDVTLDKEVKGVLSKPITLHLSAVDDGFPTQGKLSVVWNKDPGPGQVAFAPPAQDLVDGKATTTLRFSEPGEYQLDAVVSDGPYGRSCCRTHAFVHATIGPN